MAGKPPPYVPYRGACIMMPYNEVPHLFVILTDSCKDGNCLAIMITSVKPGRVFDNACHLRGGEHVFIVKESYALYRMAEEVSIRHITRMVQLGFYSSKPDASAELLEQLTAGLFASDETRRRIINYANAQKI